MGQRCEWWERKESNLAAEVLIYSQARLHNGLRSRASKNEWRRAEEANPPRGLPGATVFETACQPNAAAPSLKRRKPPRLIAGRLSCTARCSLCLHVGSP